MNRSNRFPLLFLTLTASLAFLVCGCEKKPVVKSQVAELARVFQVPTDAAPAPAAAEPAAPEPPSGTPAEAKTYVNYALMAARTNDYASAVIALQEAQRLPMKSTAQHQAVYETMQAMTSDLVARAERGDQQAKAQLAAIERTRSQ